MTTLTCSSCRTQYQLPNTPASKISYPVCMVCRGNVFLSPQQPKPPKQPKPSFDPTADENAVDVKMTQQKKAQLEETTARAQGDLSYYSLDDNSDLE